MRYIATFLTIVLSLSVAVHAQVLADHAPANTILYVGWKGTDNLGADYAQSHLKALIDASQFRQFCSESIPQLISRIHDLSPDVPPQLDIGIDVATLLIHHDTAIFIAPAAHPGLPVDVTILCDAGSDAAALSQKISTLLQGSGAPLTCKTVDTFVVLATSDLDLHPQAPLAQAKPFTDAMAGLNKNPIFALYVDGPGLMKIAEMGIQAAPPDFQQSWPKIRDALGLDGLQSVAVTSGFLGKNWSTQAVVLAPAPRKGLLQLFDAPPLDPALLKRIPVTSVAASAGTFDAAALYHTVDSALQQFAPDQAQQLDQAVAGLNAMLGFDLDKDLLGAIGPQWAVYEDPQSLGNSNFNSVVINRPRNPESLESSLTKLEDVANVMIKNALVDEKGLTVEFRHTEESGLTLHYLAIPLITPAWTIHDGNWYIALYPQTVIAAAQAPADKSILDSPAFQSVKQQVSAPDNFTSFQFLDVPRAMPDGYSADLAMQRLIFGAPDLAGVQTPLLILPQLSTLIAESEPAGTFGWSDNAGFHAASVTPFPCAEMLTGQLNVASVVGTTSLMTSLLLPSLNRSREIANRVKSESNLKQIGNGIAIYENMNAGAYPADLGALYKSGFISPAVFIDPTSNTQIPSGLSQDQTADWINTNSDYVYAGAGLKAGTDPMIVVAYEKSDHHGQGRNVLFNDFHAEWESNTVFDQSMQNSNQLRGSK